MKRTRRNDVLRKALLALAAFLACVAAVELILRTTHAFGARTAWTRPDPGLGYSFLPGRQYWYLGPTRQAITGRINSYGWRDNERPLAKPHNSYRIAVLGDSFVEAFQVDIGRTFLARTERQLTRETGHPVELMNFGRSGYSPSEELLVLRNHAMRFSPDLVILFFCPSNDIADVRRDTAFDTRRPFFTVSKGGELLLDNSFSKTVGFKLRQWISLLRPHSVLLSLMSARYAAYAANKSQEMRGQRSQTSATRIPGYLSLCTSHPDPVFLENYALAKRLIQAMAQLCKEHKVRFLLVCVDVYMTAQDEAESPSSDPSFDLGFFERDLAGFARANGVEYLGLQTVFGQAQQETGLSHHLKLDGHWDDDGHRLVSRELVARLRTFMSQ